jgi:membrane-associated HD superfamily phosphohydrolase
MFLMICDWFESFHFTFISIFFNGSNQQFVTSVNSSWRCDSTTIDHLSKLFFIIRSTEWTFVCLLVFFLVFFVCLFVCLSVWNCNLSLEKRIYLLFVLIFFGNLRTWESEQEQTQQIECFFAATKNFLPFFSKDK